MFVFLVILLGTLYGFGYLIRQAFIAFPKIATESIPPMIAYAQSHGIELPFSDLESLKAATLDMIKDEFLFVGNFARAATRQFVFGLVGIVVAVSLFLNPRIQKLPSEPKDPNLRELLVKETSIEACEASDRRLQEKSEPHPVSDAWSLRSRAWM